MRNGVRRGPQNAVIATARFLAVAAVVGLAIPAMASNCRFEVMPTSLAFNIYEPGSSSPLDTSTSFQMFCTPNTVGSVRISTGGAGTFNPRSMAGPTATRLNYNIHTQAAASSSNIWGNGTSGTLVPSFTSTSQDKIFTFTIYGRIPAGMDVPEGTYTDSLFIELYENGIKSGNTSAEQYSLPVTATVQGSCTIESFNLSFGDYDPLATAPLDAAASVRAFCNSGITASISLSNGVNFSGGSRRLAGPSGEFMLYNIYTSSLRTTVWNSANTLSATSTSRTVPLGGPSGLTAFGRIPAAQKVRAGAYTDTVIATVNY